MSELVAPPWAKRFREMRRLQVLRTGQVTPGMRRITLGGEEFEGLHGGPNLKLVLPPRAGAPLLLPLRDEKGNAIWAEGPDRPAVRTYTVRRIDPAARELDIDFVMHGAEGGGDEGVASGWAARAVPGDEAGIAAIGGLDWRPAGQYLLLGDHTALPAITNILAALPSDAKGQAFLEVPDAGEQQELAHPPGITLHWLHHGPHGAGHSDALERAAKAAIYPADGDIFAWVGTESAAARSIRTYLRDEVGLHRRRLLVIGYWKLGMSETDYGKKHDHDRDEDHHAVAREEHERTHRQDRPA